VAAAWFWEEIFREGREEVVMLVGWRVGRIEKEEFRSVG
jgi:hypothetical protein